MTSSIRTFLLVNLLLSVTLVTSLAIIGNLFMEHRGFQTHLDSQLTLSAHTIKAFISNKLNKHDFKTIQKAIDNVPRHVLSNKEDSSEDELNLLLKSVQFQVWDNEDNLVLHSYAAPTIPIDLHNSGFHNTWISNNPWRTYNLYLPKSGYRITVLQRHDFRVELEKQITEDSITIMVITYPFLGLLIWVIVGRGLNSIKRTTQAIKERKHNNLKAIKVDNIPTEIHPLIDELNLLFLRLYEGFEREHRFAGDAAHELRTPLAALNAHVQVALNSDDIDAIKESLRKVTNGVDRSSHVVEQLLTLSRMVPNAQINKPEKLNLKTLASDMIIELLNHADQKQIALELDCSEDSLPILTGNKAAILILLRNLIDNAIRYSPSDSTVKIEISQEPGQLILRVVDNGPGISEELRERVFERFFRVLGHKTSGSGLGLGIVKQIVDLHRATISLSKPKNHTGLQVEILFPILNNSIF